MKPLPCPPTATRQHHGFTFVELLIALAIMVTAFTVIFTIFNATLNAWNRGTDALTKLHHGDFVMDQLVQSLRSMAFFDSAPEFYEFRLDKGFAGGGPGDTISWVTSSSAFMPLDSPYAHGLRRLNFTVGRTAQAQYGVKISALPHLADPEEYDAEEWVVSTRVIGFRCRIFDDELGQWQDGWDESNAIPSLVELTLYMEPEERYGRPITIQRAVAIPLAPAVTSLVSFTESEL